MLGRKWLTSVALLLVIVVQSLSHLCNRTECKCTVVDQLRRASCHFEPRQRLTFDAADFPEDLSSVELIRGKELRFGLDVLARLRYLKKVSIKNATKVFVQKHSFANLTSPSLLFEFCDSEELLLEEGSFKSLHGPVSARMERIQHLVIQRATFTWLSDLTVSGVAKLELLDEAFLLDHPLDKRGASLLPQITLERVNLESLGRSTFRSSSEKIRIVNSNVNTIKTDAFDAIEIHNVVFENSTIGHIAKGAFNDRTLVDSLRMSAVEIHEISPGALSFGTTQLIVEKSKIHNIHKGAIDITVAKVTLTSNTIRRIHSGGVHLHKWSSIYLVNNTFVKLDAEAFTAPFQALSDKVPECNFTGNIIYDFAGKTFDFALTEDVNVTIENNYFASNCHCDMSSSLENFITGSNVYNNVYDTSSCNVDRRTSKCYRLEEGFVPVWNFTDQVCGETVKCEEVQRDAALPPVIPVITPVDDLTVHDEIERERLILGSVIVIFVFGMVIVALVSLVKCIKDHNYCGKSRVIIRSTANHVFAATPNHDLTPTASAHSFSQFSVHEYAQVQRKKEEPRDDSPLEDKATQTLPEELTQELIESLREKLNDPSNFPEARDMIEHLYDLIKTEDSGNRNDTTSLKLDDLERGNLYEAVSRRRSEPGKQVRSTWTRAPTPERLVPLYAKVVPPDVTRPPLLCEYLEPRDRPAHLYAEPNYPRVCDYAEPSDTAQHVYTELPNVPRNHNRPLPSPS